MCNQNQCLIDTKIAAHGSSTVEFIEGIALVATFLFGQPQSRGMLAISHEGALEALLFSLLSSILVLVISRI